MKVLFFNYEYPPLGGGAGNATSYILKEFSQIPDLRVDLITSAVDNKFSSEKIGNNITIHKLPIGDKTTNLHYQSQFNLLRYTWKAYIYSKKLVKKNKYNLSHSFFGIPCGFVSLILKWQHKIPYIISLRGADVPGYSDRFPLIYFLLKPLIKLIWSQSISVVSNSQGLKDLALESKPNQKIEIIFNGIDTNEFTPAENKANEEFTILCVSRITERKGIKYLIEAIKLMEKENIKLIIAGEGDRKIELEKLAKDLHLENKIAFLGRVEHSQITRLYQKADVFILPSLNEGMSNTMLEALASGLPLIATATGGTKELVTNGKNGFIIKMENAKDITEKIRLLATNSELQEKMSLASRKKALTLSWKNVAMQYHKIYKNE